MEVECSGVACTSSGSPGTAQVDFLCYRRRRRGGGERTESEVRRHGHQWCTKAVENKFSLESLQFLMCPRRIQSYTLVSSVLFLG